MDLRHTVPRSPYALLAGRAWLPRAIDKARAKHAGTLGEFLFPGPLDEEMVAFLGITLPAFEAAVAAAADDAAVVAWLDGATAKTAEEWDGWRRWLWGHGPVVERGRQIFARRLAEVAPGRTDIRTWCHLLAVEEGHPVPEDALALTELP